MDAMKTLEDLYMRACDMRIDYARAGQMKLARQHEWYRDRLALAIKELKKELETVPFVEKVTEKIQGKQRDGKRKLR